MSLRIIFIFNILTILLLIISSCFKSSFISITIITTLILITIFYQDEKSDIWFLSVSPGNNIRGRCWEETICSLSHKAETIGFGVSCFRCSVVINDNYGCLVKTRKAARRKLGRLYSAFETKLYLWSFLCFTFGFRTKKKQARAYLETGYGSLCALNSWEKWFVIEI